MSKKGQFPSVLNQVKNATKPVPVEVVLTVATKAGVTTPAKNLEMLADAGMLEVKDGQVTATPKAFGQG